MAKIVKGEMRGRPGKWIADFRDSAGVRRWITRDTKRECEDELVKAVAQSRQRTRPAGDPNITLSLYAADWLRVRAVKQATRESYTYILNHRILPALGALRVRDVSRGDVKAFLGALVAGEKPLARSTARFVLSVLGAVMASAVDDEIVVSNPCDGMGKVLGSDPARPDESKALTRQQAADLIDAAMTSARESVRRCATLFLFMVRTGTRLGEALGMQWNDLDFHGRKVHVARSVAAHGRIETPKSGKARAVDMSAGLADALLRHRAGQGDPDGAAWVFPSEVGTPLDASKVRKAFAAACKAAGLPPHLTPHSLRHTFGSLLISAGESPAYVQRQMGHASITMTVDTYGSHLPMGNVAAVDRLDGPSAGSGSKTVAAGAAPQATPAEGLA